MQTIRFDGVGGLYKVTYRNIDVAALAKNKNKWFLYSLHPAVSFPKSVFYSLKDAKRFVRIAFEKFDYERNLYLNRVYLNTHETAEKVITVIKTNQPAFKFIRDVFNLIKRRPDD